MYYLSEEDRAKNKLASPKIKIKLWRAVLRKQHFLKGGRVSADAFVIRYDDNDQPKEPSASLFQSKSNTSEYCSDNSIFFERIKERLTIRAGCGAVIVESQLTSDCNELLKSNISFYRDGNECVKDGLVHWCLDYGGKNKEEIQHIAAYIAHTIKKLYRLP